MSKKKAPAPAKKSHARKLARAVKPETSGARKKAIAEIEQRIEKIDAAESAAAGASQDLTPPDAAPAATAASDANVGDQAPASAAAEPKPARKPRTPKAAKEKAPKRVSCLDAAATVLESTTEPMQAKQMIVEMQTRGLWTSGKGKTPEASLYAAIIREIAAKGESSRFRKTDKGLFAANVPAAAAA